MDDSERRAAEDLYRDLQRLDDEDPLDRRADGGGENISPGHPRDLGDYELLARIGGGGMGVVYRARQRSLGREVAIKLLPPVAAGKAETLQRFFREARVAAAIDHPSIVQVLEAGIQAGHPFIAMQYIRGISLEEFIQRRQPLPVKRALAIIRDVALALDAAHRAGVIHRDIKPGNILIEGDLHSAPLIGRVFLADFGLAFLRDDESLTRSGEVLGTPAYMSSEQARGLPAEQASDIYSLGATLYALLSGRPPYEDSRQGNIIAKIARKPPPSLRRQGLGVDRDAAVICEKAMSWEPRRRYDSAAAMAQDIDRRLSGRPILARPASLSYRASLWVKRNPTAALAATAVFFLMVFGFGFERSWRRDKILAEVETLMASSGIDEAFGKLSEAPGFPWSLADYERELELWIQIHVAKGELEEAVKKAGKLPGSRQERAYGKIQDNVIQRLDDARVLSRAQMWWSCLDDARCALEGIAALIETKNPNALIKISADQMKVAFDVVIAGLLETNKFRLATQFWEARNSNDRIRIYRDILTTALGLLLDERGKAGAQEADVVFSGILSSALEGVRLSGDSSVTWMERNRYMFQVLDYYLPAFPLDRAFQAKRWVALLESLRKYGDMTLTLEFPESTWTMGFPVPMGSADLIGDPTPEIVISANNRLQVLGIGDGGIKALDQFKLEVGEKRFINQLNLHDLNGDGKKDLILYLYDQGNRQGSLKAFQAGAEGWVEYGIEKNISNSPIAYGQHAIAAADIDGDGGAEIFLGMASSGEHERQVLVVWRPFTIQPRIDPLPIGEDIRADVFSVFVEDLDGDGSLEVGCVTGPWNGWDIRIWKYSGGKFTQPVRYGPLGTLEDAVPVDIDGKKPSELLVTKSSYFTIDRDVFRDPPHTGIEEGVYIARLDGSRPSETPFLWKDAFGETIDSPEEFLFLRSLSTGPLINGRRSFAAAWRRKKEELYSQFLDLYLQGTNPESFSRHRLFWFNGDGDLQGLLLSIPTAAGAEIPGLFVIRNQMDDPSKWEARLFGFSPPVETVMKANLENRLVDAYIRTGKYHIAEELASKTLQEIFDLPPAAAFDLLLGQARASARGLLWDQAREAIGKLELVVGDKPEEIQKEVARMKDAASRSRRLRQQQPLRVPDCEISLEPLKKGNWKEPLVAGSIPFPALPADSLLMLSFDVTIEEFGWSRNVLAGISPQNGIRADTDSYGIRFSHTGGGKDSIRHVTAQWGVIQPGNLERGHGLEDGATYRMTLESTLEGRLILRVEELTGEKRMFWNTYPPYDASRTLEYGVVGNPMPPLQVGKDFRLGIIGEPTHHEYDLDRTARLRFKNIELRTLPIE